MHTPARVMISAFALLLVAAFAIVPGTARANMDKPTWAAGNFWVYSFTSGSGAATFNGTLRFDVTGTETVTLNGTDYPSYHVAADLKLPFGGGLSFQVTPDIWFSTDTLAIVKIRATVPPIANLTTQTTVVVAGSPPQTIHWPLTVGASWTDSTVVWTSSTNATRTTWSHAALSTRFDVQADATISVPAGTFATTPIKETNTANLSYTMNYWSAQVGNWVRVGEYDNSGRNTQNFNLTSSSFQGGNFFTSVLFGLPVWIWLVLLVVILVAIIGVFAVRRRRPPTRAMPPPQMPPQEPMGPPPP
jgi:hypothetical protein